ncbi:hypothetical protein TeGR_g5150 [Tetraparma gracilis]|uniref:Prenyltransferase alpha-alpha toroid domain-containing protein n=1 Tax=Tetraparma gracilis TaxID=2962635 RepID=A0ABQ6N6Y7_9STRA|nr:hypothetical protein TeGR_g5150 [Tetraparma gracilis]
MHYSLSSLPPAYASLDTNRLTLLHFLVHSLDLLRCPKLFSPAGAETREGITGWILNCLVRPPAEPGEPQTAGFVGSTYMGAAFLPSAEASLEAPPSAERGGPHIAMTYTALLTLLALGFDLSLLPAREILEGVSALQNLGGEMGGSFRSHHEGSESDMRFLYCAVCIDRALWKAHSPGRPYGGSGYIRPDLIVGYVRRCSAYDGGLGLGPGLESHGGSYFTGLASLALMGRLGDLLDGGGRVERAVGWGVNRQIDGMQGRINKPPDTCYSYWVGGGLHLVEKFAKGSGMGAVPEDLLANGEVVGFVLECQHPAFGGVGKLKGAPPDVLHTFYSLCYLSMSGGVAGLREVDVELGCSKRVGDMIRSDKSYAELAREMKAEAEKEAEVEKEKEKEGGGGGAS